MRKLCISAFAICLGLCLLPPTSQASPPLDLQSQVRFSESQNHTLAGAFLDGGLRLFHKADPARPLPHQTTGNTGMGIALPLLIFGVPLMGTALLTGIVGSIVALITQRGLVAWGITSLVVGTLGLLTGLLFLSLIYVSLPALLLSSAAIALGISNFVMWTKIRAQRRWKRLYGSQIQRTQEAVVQLRARPSTNGVAIAF